MRREGISPAATADKQVALQEELDEFEASLPQHLQHRPEGLGIVAYSADAHGFFLIRTIWLQCHCDLYRFFIPGIRESVSNAVAANTPVEYVDFCVQKCLDSALRLCDFWAEMLELWFADTIEETVVDVSIYQVSQILRSLHHLLPPTGPHCVDSVKSALRRTIDVVSASRKNGSRVSAGLEAATRLVETLGQASPETRRSSPGNIHHLPSYGSLIPDAYPSDETDGSEQPDMGKAVSDPREAEAPDAATAIGPSLHPSDIPPGFGPEDTLLGVDEHLLEFLPWTPVSMSRMAFPF